uniref:Uncharacterized protein n=1 Tax=Sphaerodactylus townsendi TaxID=933632 RepID=A0ACB8ER34_9SAUR
MLFARWPGAPHRSNARSRQTAGKTDELSGVGSSEARATLFWNSVAAIQQLQEVDITLPDHKTWYERYKNDIPVFHLNGQFLMKHRMDIEELQNQLLNIELQDGGKR